MSTYFLFQARSIKSEISHSFIASHKNLMKTTKSKKHSTITVVHVIIDIESARRTSLWYSVILSTYIWADTVAKLSNQSHLSLGLRYSAEIQYKKVKQGKTSYYNRVESPEKQTSLWKNGRRPLPEGEWADVCLYSSTVTMSWTYLGVRINDLVLRALY